MRKRQPGDGLMYLVRVGGFLALVYSACPQAARFLCIWSAHASEADFNR